MNESATRYGAALLALTLGMVVESGAATAEDGELVDASRIVVVSDDISNTTTEVKHNTVTPGSGPAAGTVGGSTTPGGAEEAGATEAGTDPGAGTSAPPGGDGETKNEAGDENEPANKANKANKGNKANKANKTQKKSSSAGRRGRP